jgi:penicillin amidase
MVKIAGRILLGVGIVLLVLIVLIAIFGPPWTRQTAEKSFPVIDGEIHLAGLEGPVEVYRDAMGVPHIYATTQHDLFFAQGYVHAQDRFWQMDFWRHQGAGRLSELLGSNLVETDLFLRTIGWERVARQELENLDPESTAILESYAEGVNAYLAEHAGTSLALEYAFLPLLNRGYQPKPWIPLNTMTWAKAMAWDLRGNMDTEINRALLLKDLTPEQVDFFYPPYPADRPVIVNHPHVTGEVSGSPEIETALTASITPALVEVHTRFAAIDSLTGGGFEGIGSNSWVISGDLTNTGMPLLANDPHLGVQMPAIWYEVGLHCVESGPDCQVDVTGFSFAGVPGVVIGHNDKIAWGLTNVGPDVMDLYIEKINPENPDQYEFQGQWVDMEIITEEIQVAGGETVEERVRLTRHGPIITDVYGLDEFQGESGIDLPDEFALAVRWTALEPSCVLCAVWKFDKAGNWDEFRAAASQFAVPSQNLVFASVDGDIGYQTPGNIPIRTQNHTGMIPVPGWTGEFEWQGYIPFEEMPYAHNPPEGFIITANNAVVGPEYPYTISRQWAYGQRAQVILDWIEAAPGPIDINYIKQMQADNKMLVAQDLLPILMAIPIDDAVLTSARDTFSGWDYQMDMDSAPGALFAVFWKHLLAETFEDDLPEFFWPEGGGGWMEVVRGLLADPSSPWWDDQTTPDVETRDDMFHIALEGAVKEIQKLGGKDPAEWAWGDLHTLALENQVMGNFPIIKNAFNRGPFPTAGGSAIVNATGWSTQDGYNVIGLPSMRMIVDFSNYSNSLTIHTTGQSGHPYHPHYVDMVDPWRLIQYTPMHWERAKIEADAEGYLRLVP